MPIPAMADHVGLHLVDIKVEGATVYDQKRLLSVYSELIGTTVPLSAIYGVAQAITKLYGDDGYVLSRAIIPPQDIDPKNATIMIVVSEAYVDKVEWPDSFNRYRDVFSGYTAKITAERPSNVKTVTRYLLLANELPGITVNSTFVASQTNPQASTLVVTATEKPVDLYASVDNHGTEARGPWEYVLSATFNNILRQHEALTATVAGATDTKELTYAAVGGRAVLNDEGATAFYDLSYSWGTPGTAPLQSVSFSGTSANIDAGVSLAAVRSRETQLTLSALAFASDNEATMLGAPSSDDRLRVVRLKADLAQTDTSGGQLQAGLVLSHGFVGLGSSQNGDLLLSRQNGRVDFTTLDLNAIYDYPLGQRASIHSAFGGQYAFTPLLSPEECGYGGKDFGRAFDPSEITGDSCALVSTELRLDPELPDLHIGKVQLYGFADYGAIFRIAPASGTPDRDTAASAGVGIRLINEKYSADLTAAKPLFGRTDEGWRAFLTLTARN